MSEFLKTSTDIVSSNTTLVQIQATQANLRLINDDIDSIVFNRKLDILSALKEREIY